MRRETCALRSGSTSPCTQRSRHCWRFALHRVETRSNWAALSLAAEARRTGRDCSGCRCRARRRDARRSTRQHAARRVGVYIVALRIGRRVGYAWCRHPRSDRCDWSSTGSCTATAAYPFQRLRRTPPPLHPALVPPPPPPDCARAAADAIIKQQTLVTRSCMGVSKFEFPWATQHWDAGSLPRKRSDGASPQTRLFGPCAAAFSCLQHHDVNTEALLTRSATAYACAQQSRHCTAPYRCAIGRNRRGG